MVLNTEDFEANEARERFAAIPAERTFYILKLFVLEDGSVNGGGYYDGAVLRALNIGPLTTAALESAGDAITAAGQKALARIAPVLEFGQMLDGLVQSMPKEEGEHSDSKDSNDTEGSADSRAAATASE